MGFALSGCPKAKPPVMEEPEPVAEVTPVEVVPMVPTLDVGTSFATAPSFLDAVYFDYMKAELTQASRMSLQKNASILKTALASTPALKIRIEGHADDRGTLEYNMALGERRAKAVKDYYASLGVAKSALSTISYGEERPVCTDAGEDCWWRNRRGETTLKAGTPVQIPLSN